LWQTLAKYVAWDLEWNARGEITAAAFVDSENNSEVFLRQDFLNESNPERALLETILIKLQEYPTSMGWFTTGSSKYQDGSDSDLIHLHNRCEANGLDSIVGFRQNNQPYLPNLTHIDLHSVFDKKIIKDAVYKGGFYNLSLNQVSKFILKEGKYKGQTGDSFNYLSPEEKREYVLQDAELVMKLSKHDNYKVLDFMFAIAELCELDLEYVCRTNLTSWWKHVYNKMLENGQCEFPTRQFDSSEKWNYKGGEVFKPKQGFYGKYVIVFDAKSLYPSIAILYNISFDTINCDCCRDNAECQIVNPDVLKDCKVESQYWICNKHDGALKTKLIVFRQERFRQLELGNDAKQSVLKILINGAYGVFGKDYFYFYDPRVAELITAYGRYTLLQMKALAEQSGFEAIYGDTDSIFIHLPADSIEQVKNLVSGFQQLCEQNLHVGIELKCIYSKSIMSKGKKHYVGYGIDDKGKDILDIKGMEGKKTQ
jgi:DNA polymerase elongation subunit (family B)